MWRDWTMELKVELDGDDVVVSNEAGNWVAFPIQVIQSRTASIDTKMIGGPTMPSSEGETFIAAAWEQAVIYAGEHKLH